MKVSESENRITREPEHRVSKCDLLLHDTGHCARRSKTFDMDDSIDRLEVSTNLESLGIIVAVALRHFKST